MKSVFKLLSLCLLISVQSCDIWNPNGYIVYDEEDLKNWPVDDEDENESKYLLTNSITIDGLNLKYSISRTKLSVGDVLRARVDSETDPKPEASVLWDSVKVAHFSNLPDSLEIELTKTGVHKITFEAQFSDGTLRTSSVDITVE